MDHRNRVSSHRLSHLVVQTLRYVLSASIKKQQLSWWLTLSGLIVCHRSAAVQRERWLLLSQLAASRGQDGGGSGDAAQECEKADVIHSVASTRSSRLIHSFLL